MTSELEQNIRHAAKMAGRGAWWLAAELEATRPESAKRYAHEKRVSTGLAQPALAYLGWGRR